MVGVLHTWTRDLLYHPHLHYIVAGGGLSSDGHWLPSREDFLVHVKPLAGIFQAKCRDQLKKPDLFAQVDAPVWKKDWVCTVSQSAVASKPADLLPLISFEWPSALSASSRWRMAKSRFSTRHRPLSRRNSVPSLPKSVCVVCCSTSCRTDASTSDMTACSALPTVICATGPDNGSLPVRSPPRRPGNIPGSNHRVMLPVAPTAEAS
jgi:Putative transposase